MTLKLIDKDLKSKYAEALYRNETSYEKEIDRRFKRLNLDFVRSSQTVDAGSQVFLNRIRQKRTKWTQDDLSFRDHYRLVCRNVTNRKLDNLKQAMNPNLNNKRNANKIDPVMVSKFNLLQEQLNNSTNSPMHFSSDPNLSQANNQAQNIESNNSENLERMGVPRLPEIRNMNRESSDIDEDLYSKYSKSDRGFLEKFPAKVELTVTDLGKQFIYKEQHKHVTLNRQKQKYNHIQNGATTDSRFKDLVQYLQ